MEKIKLTRKDLKGPDEFVSTTTRIYAWLIAHQKGVLYAVAGFLFLFLVILLSQAYIVSIEKKAVDLLFEANRDAGFTAYGFNTENQDKEALTKKALGNYDSIIKKYSMTRTAGFASFYKGSLLYREGKYGDALKSYEKALKKLKTDSVKSLILMDVSYALEAMGKWKETCDNLKSILDLNAYPKRDLLYYKLGECLMRTEKSEESKKYFNMIVSEYPASEFIEMAGSLSAKVK